MINTEITMPYKNLEDRRKWAAENTDKVQAYKMRWLESPKGQAYYAKQNEANERLKAERKAARAIKIEKTEAELTVERLTKKSKDKLYRQLLREKAINMMGGQCSVCFIDDHDVLEFDHIKPLLRRSSGITTKGETAAVVIRDEDRQLNFQLLCSNCHTKKTRLNNEFEYKGMNNSHEETPPIMAPLPAYTPKGNSRRDFRLATAINIVGFNAEG